MSSENYDYARTSRTVTVDGRRVHYNEAGDGPVAILLHGAGPGVSGWANFEHNLPVFAESFRTLVIDQPGFGDSEGTDFEGDYYTHSAETVVGLMDELGIDKAHLVGNSLGGGVALRLALNNPDRVDRLALMGPGGLTTRLFTPEPTLGHTRLYEYTAPPGPTRDKLAVFMRGMVFDEKFVTEDMIDDRFERSQRPGAAESFERMRVSFLSAEGKLALELWREASRVQHETLMLWGREDLINPYDGGLFAFSQMPNASLHVMSRCGHWAQIERADEFNRTVLGFLLEAE
ncbi:4,5:9,10-diseco-3-hydroxy-5,9,17-trioxoandrosta-1(10),2-diene-4-oate hydrolase [Rhodococcus sp. OK519]|uniref:alpha/beta fold hydrolase n=1 Tax=Rhodococcus sp. OK519 TaxID=2135729 RepID=UPI000D39C1BB|nr:4,5:9,10-diseco-3-hydroxy-5,9,17-trioxoandrosta-1(10),2-diene-4-oate hydrolase [Rhodococcus sp. OK519]